MVAETSDNSLVLRRQFNASPAEVFQAWISPDAIREWFRPAPDFTHTVVEVDFRVGGSYRIGFLSPEGKQDTVGGEFIEILPDQRIVCSWTWEEPHDYAGQETQLTVEFVAVEAGTELVLTHQRFVADEMKQDHMLGWTGALDQLVEHIHHG